MAKYIVYKNNMNKNIIIVFPDVKTHKEMAEETSRRREGNVISAGFVTPTPAADRFGWECSGGSVSLGIESRGGEEDTKLLRRLLS